MTEGLEDSRSIRLLDLVLSAGALALLLPLLAGVAAAVKLTSPGPVFYRARRVGRHGRIFLLYKFRSMVADADQHGPAITVGGDQRITPLGRFLRGSKIDELPQLINVLKGDMHLVGPRPEDPRYVELYNARQRRILLLKPGVTSPASLEFRHEEKLLEGSDWQERYVREVMPRKIELDLAYARSRSLWTDLRILLRTAAAIFR